MFILSSIEHRGFNLKSSFQLIFKAYKNKKWQSSLGKTPLIFLKKNERFKFEQKPIGIDAFNKLEEKKKKRKN